MLASEDDRRGGGRPAEGERWYGRLRKPSVSGPEAGSHSGIDHTTTLDRKQAVPADKYGLSRYADARLGGNFPEKQQAQRRVDPRLRTDTEIHRAADLTERIRLRRVIAVRDGDAFDSAPQSADAAD